MGRVFEARPAVRSSVPLLVGLVGPSGSGKTYSALRLATGMQKVFGGDIGFIDTEAGRALHYADMFKFLHLPFEAPFNPLSYLEAVEYFARRGVRTIVTDSTSHMHEGPGGTLEQHEAEMQRLAGDNYEKRNRMTMLGWQRPKAELRRFINTILQLRVNTIWCFRAKDKLKLERGKEPEPLGLAPVADKNLFYEMTVSALLYPNSGGVPTWRGMGNEEAGVIKLPSQFKPLFAQRRPLDEETGQALASWAAGGAAPPAGGAQSPPTRATAATSAPPSPPADQAALEMLEAQLVANGLTAKRARGEWFEQTVGRWPTADAPPTEDEVRLAIDRAEREAAA
jgi:hypothetical protein